MSRRLGISPREPGSGGDDDAASTTTKKTCPDIWELSNGDIAVIGRDLTDVYRPQLPDDMSVGDGERLVVIPGPMLRAAKKDIPDA
ncbi:SC5B8.23c, unknown, len: 78 aa [Actinokineospora spheciospongiae]|uniref:Uncharacterized protein n=1 Tax=Actinokineospora spheciospongiae TaxID=909613 RepID=W7J0B4_9PSEU|nr:SC5B8.23c, unknown, len: 78 aa [Actinokineospora spheciospongiae]